MVDGSALLNAFLYGLMSSGVWREERGSNLLDGGAPFYDTYETADGGHVAVGALEPQFYAELLAGLGLADVGLPSQYDRAGWPVLRERFATAFQQRTRDEWAAAFSGSDACVAPVLTAGEAPAHPHCAARGTFTTSGGLVQPAPRPGSAARRTRSATAAQARGGHRRGAGRLGLSGERIAALRAAGTVG